jgi:hypothetical protein
MKKLFLIVFILTELSKLSWSQSDSKTYQVDNRIVKSYLDSIRIVYGENNWLDNFDFSYFVFPDGFNNVRLVFGNNVRLLDAPTDKAKTVKSLHFGDTVKIPDFVNGKVTGPSAYRSGYCDNCYDVYLFCITRDGCFGFIFSKDLVSTTVSLPESEYLLLGNLSESALVRKDFSGSKVFNTDILNYSDDSRLLVYSVKTDTLINPPIYKYDISSDDQSLIGYGYSPVFLSNSIIYCSLGNTNNDNEQIHLYDLSERTDKIILDVPDSLTLYQWGPDGGQVGEIQSGQFENWNCIYLLLSQKNNNLESNTERYILKLNGELIKK